jgi:pseudaminic acid synthase
MNNNLLNQIQKEVFIIAELSANHNGSLETAINTVKAAKRAGANAIKLQTYTADTMTIDSQKEDFIIKKTIWQGQNLYKLYEKAYTPWEWHETLFRTAEEEGIICFSTPFDKTSVDFLEDLENPIYKIASFEITDIELIKYVASKDKPIILSTGIAEEEDISLAIKTIREINKKQLYLLKCTSSYPAPMDEVNLITLSDYESKFDVIPGLSDHTKGIVAPIVATTLGARVIEKHFILDQSIGGPDASFSLDEKEFSDMVKAIRDAEKAIGEISYELTENQLIGKNFSRSLYFVKDLKKGEIISEKHIRSVRPGYGAHPKYKSSLIGIKSRKDYQIGDRVIIEEFF